MVPWILLYAALVAAPPSTAAEPVEPVVPGLDKARSKVAACAIGRVRDLNRADVPLERIADRALNRCRRQEKQLMQVMQGARTVKLSEEEALAAARLETREPLMIILDWMRSSLIGERRRR